MVKIAALRMTGLFTLKRPGIRFGLSGLAGKIPASPVFLNLETQFKVYIKNVGHLAVF
jgi:hypothetical protein